ncbi:hypothetical protein GGI20_001510 [Coemansia sp. BCRC 34301]|nr:hypothetical protein GGI20_001510 [Coemansia sp. BCRC 34301]
MAIALNPHAAYYYNLVIANATPALFGFALLYFIVSAVLNVWSRRQRDRREKAEMAKRREAYASRLTGQSTATEKGKASEPNTGLPFVLRPRAPASTANRQFGARTGEISSMTPRFSGPTSKCTMMKDTCSTLGSLAGGYRPRIHVQVCDKCTKSGANKCDTIESNMCGGKRSSTLAEELHVGTRSSAGGSGWTRDTSASIPSDIELALAWAASIHSGVFVYSLCGGGGGLQLHEQCAT